MLLSVLTLPLLFPPSSVSYRLLSSWVPIAFLKSPSVFSSLEHLSCPVVLLMYITLPFFLFLHPSPLDFLSIIMKRGVARDGGRETLREVGFIWPYNINVLLCIMYSAPKLTFSAWLSLLRLCLINKITWNIIAVKWVKFWSCFSLSVRQISAQMIKMSIYALMRDFAVFFGAPTYLQLTSST